MWAHKNDIVNILETSVFWYHLYFRNNAAIFIEICSIYANQLVIKVDISIINSDTLIRSYDDLYFGVTQMVWVRDTASTLSISPPTVDR